MQWLHLANTVKVIIFSRRTSKETKNCWTYDEQFLHFKLKFVLKLIVIVYNIFSHKKNLIVLSKRLVDFSKFSIFLQPELFAIFDLNSLIIHYLLHTTPHPHKKPHFWTLAFKMRRKSLTEKRYKKNIQFCCPPILKNYVWAHWLLQNILAVDGLVFPSRRAPLLSRIELAFCSLMQNVSHNDTNIAATYLKALILLNNCFPFFFHTAIPSPLMLA